MAKWLFVNLIEKFLNLVDCFKVQQEKNESPFKREFFAILWLKVSSLEIFFNFNLNEEEKCKIPEEVVL